MWVDETHDKYNTFMIGLLRSCGVVLELQPTPDKAKLQLQEDKYDIVISDRLDLFDLPFKSNGALKIVNTGGDNLARWKGLAKAKDVQVVDRDAHLIKAIVGLSP